MDMEKILVVDDEAAIAELISFNLSKAGYEVYVAGDGPSAMHAIQEQSPDLVVLDIMLPGMDGFEVCRQIRSNPITSHIPILFLTARREEVDRIVGLELGADDYVTKPFSPRELMARVKAILRRTIRTSKDPANDVIKIGELMIDDTRHLVQVSGEPVELTAREYDLLRFLAVNAGKVFSRDSLLEKLWDYDFFGDARTVDVHIRHIREKIERNPGVPEYILTVRGVGYKFKENRL
jgi:two-component system OmpR family response regulator/two-component system alkaline phosphatase synthesis response regulator PhoP